MASFNIGDLVVINKDPNNISMVVDVIMGETGKALYKVDKKGYFYTEDLQPLSAMGNDKERIAEKQRSVMVIGGAGYVGSVLVKTLLQEGYQVICVDNLRWGGEALANLWGDLNFSFIKADITDYDQIDPIGRAATGHASGRR